MGSASRKLKAGVEVTFLTAIGQGDIINAEGEKLSNPFEDDVAFFYGSIRIYYKRHVLAAIERATRELRVVANRHGLAGRLLVDARVL